MNKSQAPAILEYLDYREFLRDYCSYQRKHNKAFSQRTFAKNAGFPESTSSILAAIIKGARNLSQSYRLKFSKALKFTDWEGNYFVALVQFNQAKTMEEKNHFFSQISKFNGSKAAVVKNTQYKLYSKWYYLVVWNYFGCQKASTNPAQIAKSILPKLTPTQIKESIDLLLELDLIQKKANGYQVNNKHITTEKEIQSLSAVQYTSELMSLAQEVYPTVPQEERQYSAAVFSVSKSGFQSIKNRIKAFHEELRDIIERDEKEDSVYTLNIQLYPNTKVK